MTMISFRASDEERLVWLDMAKKEGRSLSEWIKDRCNLGGWTLDAVNEGLIAFKGNPEKRFQTGALPKLGDMQSSSDQI